MRRPLALVFFSLILATADFARADEAEAAALQKFETGRALFDGGSFDKALDAFKDSYKLRPSPNSRLYVARCYAKLGKVASAYVEYRFTAREANDRLVATSERRYALTRDAATEEGAELEPRVPRLTIAVPAGVAPEFVVTRNGEKVERAAWGVAVETDPSHVVVEASGPRLRPFKIELDLREGEQRRVEVLADRVPTSVVSLRFGVRPQGLAVAIDGAPVDPADFDRARELDTGAHVVDATAPGYVPFHWRKELADTERAEVRVELAPDRARQGSRGTPRWAFFATSGLAVISLGIGTVSGLSALSLANDERAKDPLLRDPSAQSTVRSRTTYADIFLASGGVLAAGAVVLFFTTDWRSPTAAPKTGFLPWAAPGGAGASAWGSF